MSDILEFLTVQCTPQGFRLGAHVAAYSANGGQDPENFSNDLVALGGFENTALNLGWRAYDRATRINNDVNGVTFFAWQGPDIYALTAAPVWTSVFNIPDQAATLDSGVHTGLYHVNTNGQEYLCGLYARAAGGIGFVKYDPRTNTWTRGAFPSAATPTLTMAKCVQFRGRLYHPANGVLQEYDPVTDALFEHSNVSIGTYSKVAVASERLFILPDTGAARLLEFAFGAVFQVASLAAESFSASYGTGGDNTLIAGLPAINGNLLVIWNCSTGGSGFRAHQITGISSVPGSAVTVTENNVVIPDGTPASQDFTGFGPNLSYANGPAAVGNNSWQFTEGGWNLEWGPLFTPSASAFAMLKINFGSFLASGTPASPPGINSSWRIDWNGAGAVMNYVNYDTLFAGVSVSFSQNSSPWGTSQRLFANGPSVTALTSEPYRDGSITRGMLLKFRIGDSVVEIPNTGGELYFGYARRIGRPDTRCTLSTGVNPTSFPGGVASFDAANNRLTDVPPTGPGRTTMTYGSPVGPGFVVGDVVTGTLSGIVGTVGIVGPLANGTLFLHSVTGSFTVNEPLTSSISGTTAVMLGTDPNPTYQIVWDQDTDAVPELEFVSVQGAHWVVEALRQYVTGPNYQLQVITADTESPTDATPQTTAGPVTDLDTNAAAGAAKTTSVVAEHTANSSASAAKTSSVVAEQISQTSETPETTGSVAEMVTGNSATPVTTTSVVNEVEPDAVYPPNINARVPARAHSQPGWVNFQTDGVGVGGDHPTANLLDSASDPAEPRGSQTGAPASGDVKAVASFELGAFGIPQVGTLRSLAGIDLVAGGDTAAYTVPTGFEAVIFGASVRCESATAISAPATAQIGFNGAVDNLFSSQLLVAVTAADDAYDYPVGGESVVAPAGSVITFRVTAGATGAAQAAELILSGYLRRS